MEILLLSLIIGILLLSILVALMRKTKKLRGGAVPAESSGGAPSVVKGTNLIEKQRQLSEEWEDTTTKRDKLKMLKMAGATQEEG